MSQQKREKESAAERRRREKEAARRLQAWESLRVGQHHPQTAPAPLTGSPTGSTLTMQPGEERSRDAMRTPLVLLLHALLGLIVTIGLTGATPLVTGSWNIPALLAAVTVSGLLLWYTAGKGTLRARRIGRLLVASILLFGGVGVITQNVLQGEALVDGSERDRALETLRDLENSVRVLTENQKLLYLPPEQAVGVPGAYQEALRQSLLIAERSNPVIAAASTPEILLLAMREVNATAVRQATAFEAFSTNLTTPEPAIAAKAETLRGEVEAMLRDDVTPRLAAVEEELYGRNEKGERP